MDLICIMKCHARETFVHPGLPLLTEAPIMMPNPIDLLFSFL